MRLVCVLVVLMTAGLPVAGRERYHLETSSDRNEYISGMDAHFKVTLTKKNGKAVNMKHKRLRATFPAGEEEVELVPEEAKRPREWYGEARTGDTGWQSFRVELLRDYPGFEAAIERMIERLRRIQEKVRDRVKGKRLARG